MMTAALFAVAILGSSSPSQDTDCSWPHACAACRAVEPGHGISEEIKVAMIRRKFEDQIFEGIVRVALEETMRETLERLVREEGRYALPLVICKP